MGAAQCFHPSARGKPRQHFCKAAQTLPPVCPDLAAGVSERHLNDEFSPSRGGNNRAANPVCISGHLEEGTNWSLGPFCKSICLEIRFLRTVRRPLSKLHYDLQAPAALTVLLDVLRFPPPEPTASITCK